MSSHITISSKRTGESISIKTHVFPASDGKGFLALPVPIVELTKKIETEPLAFVHTSIGPAFLLDRFSESTDLEFDFKLTSSSAAGSAYWNFSVTVPRLIIIYQMGTYRIFPRIF